MSRSNARKLWASHIANNGTDARAPKKKTSSPVATLDAGPDKDAKTRLQEFLQGRAAALPVYTLLDTQGSDHARTFRVQCASELGPVTATATGSSRRKAEQAAASLVLEQLRDD